MPKFCIIPSAYLQTILLIAKGPVAQLAEQLTLNQQVEGSSPSRVTFVQSPLLFWSGFLFFAESVGQSPYDFSGKGVTGTG